MKNILCENQNKNYRFVEEAGVYYITDIHDSFRDFIDAKNVSIVTKLLQSSRSKKDFYIAVSKGEKIETVLKQGYLYNCIYFKSHHTYLATYKSGNLWYLTDYRTGYQLGKCISNLRNLLWNNGGAINYYIEFLNMDKYINLPTINIDLSAKQEKEYDERIAQSILQK